MSIGSPITIPSYLLSESEMLDIIARIHSIAEECDSEIEQGSIEDVSIESLRNELSNRGVVTSRDGDGVRVIKGHENIF